MALPCPDHVEPVALSRAGLRQAGDPDHAVPVRGQVVVDQLLPGAGVEPKLIDPPGPNPRPAGRCSPGPAPAPAGPPGTGSPSDKTAAYAYKAFPLFSMIAGSFGAVC